MPNVSNLSVTASYTDLNIGDLGYISFITSSSDGWGVATVKFLMNDATNEWRTCEFGNMGYLSIAGDCSEAGAVLKVSFDIASSESICYDDNPPTQYPTGMHRVHMKVVINGFHVYIFLNFFL